MDEREPSQGPNVRSSMWLCDITPPFRVTWEDRIPLGFYDILIVGTVRPRMGDQAMRVSVKATGGGVSSTHHATLLPRGPGGMAGWRLLVLADALDFRFMSAGAQLRNATLTLRPRRGLRVTRSFTSPAGQSETAGAAAGGSRLCAYARMAARMAVRFPAETTRIARCRGPIGLARPERSLLDGLWHVLWRSDGG